MEHVYGAQLAMPKTPAAPILDKMSLADRAKTIGSLVAIEVGNHFYLSALVDEGANAVVYSMDWALLDSPYSADRRGYLKITSRPYAVPKPNPDRPGTFLIDTGEEHMKNRPIRSSAVFAVPVLLRLTVSELTQFLLDRNMHDFVFNNNLGCRFWTITVFRMLQEKHVVPENASEAFQTYVEKALGTETVQGMFPRLKQL